MPRRALRTGVICDGFGFITRIVLAAVLTIASIAKLRDRQRTPRMLELAGIPRALAPGQ